METNTQASPAVDVVAWLEQDADERREKAAAETDPQRRAWLDSNVRAAEIRRDVVTELKAAADEAVGAMHSAKESEIAASIKRLSSAVLAASGVRAVQP